MSKKRPIRRSQLISPFGVGAMVNFPNDESLMTAGLDFWPKATDECPSEWKITEERLQKRLRVTHFRLPPDYREKSQSASEELVYQKIPFIKFPRWYYCPKCGIMKQLTSYSLKEKCSGRSRFAKGYSCKDTHEYHRPMLIPSRFIAICEKGHIEDFPFMQWVHGDKPWDYETHQLRIQGGRSTSSLTGIMIECSCGEIKSMGGSFNLDALAKIGYHCSANQPWIDKSGYTGDCEKSLRVVQRGASNVYFPDIKSSIYIPVSGEEKNSRIINKKLDDPEIWSTLTSSLMNGNINRAVSDALAMLQKMDPDEFYNAAQSKFHSQQTELPTGDDEISEPEYRFSEYEAILNGTGGETTDLFTERIPLDDYDIPWTNFFQEIVLLKKLRETRVLAGFSRLLPPGEDKDIQVQKLSEDEEIQWLPALTVFGEGIFIKFNDELISKWSMQENVVRRLLQYNKQQNIYRQQRSLEPVEYSAKFLLIHTFSHLLINQLSYESGYGSSSIRERLYCDTPDSEITMSGLLLYTASGDSEGTLGGLVRQGEPDRLPEILHNTIEKAKWCTNDPVCIESSGQGIKNTNIAACHSCALIAETSCEHGNRFLDRALLIGTIRDESLGFFTNQNNNTI